MFRRIASTLVLLALGSCAGDGGPGPQRDDGETARRVLLPTAESGLQVRQWRVLDDADDPGRIAAVIMKYAIDEPGDGTDLARLAQNGFRLVPVEAAAVPALQAELGTSRDVEGWYGQAYEWRSVAEVPLDPAPQIIAVDGRVRSMIGGRLRLVVRGWTTPMEDGPYMYVEAVPEHDRTRSTRLAQVLGRRAFVGDRFPGAGLSLMMRPGTAWVLTTGTPAEVWTRDPADSGGEPTGDERGAGAPGPAVEPPSTIGATLLRHQERSAPQRDVLVFVPMIPDSLAPPPLAPPAPATMGLVPAERDSRSRAR